MRIRWRGLELPTRVERDTERLYSPTTAGSSSSRSSAASARRSATACGASCCPAWKAARSRPSRSPARSTSSPPCRACMEDVTDIVLNVKSLVVDCQGDGPKTMKVVRGQGRARSPRGHDRGRPGHRDHQQGPGPGHADRGRPVRDGDGRRERPRLRARAERVDRRRTADQEIGLIPVDAIYSPVTRVRYETEDTRVGQKTNYDRLILEIWTNGTITPEMALVEAAKILRKHLNPFVQYFELGEETVAEAAAEESAAQDVDDELQEQAQHDHRTSWTCPCGPTTAWSRPRSRPSGELVADDRGRPAEDPQLRQDLAPRGQAQAGGHGAVAGHERRPVT